MKIKHVVIGLIAVLCVGGGLFELIKWRHQQDAAGADEDDNVAPVVSVEVGKLKEMTLHRYVTAYGMITAAPAAAGEPAASARLGPMTAGVVEKVNVAEGQEVKKGQALMELNAGGVTLKYAEEEVARQKKLYAEQNTSLRNLQNAEAQLALLRVTSPLDGTVVRLNAAPGMAVDVNTVVAEVVDLSRLTAQAEIPASDAGELKAGEPVQLLTEPAVGATLSFVSPAVDTNNATVLALAPLPADSNLRPGEFVQVRITTGTHGNTLAAPEESVVTDIKGASVISVVKGDTATQVAVQTGYRDAGWVEVKGPGLKADDPVVTVGAYGLPKETKIQVVNSSEETNAP
jgi:multidrug efflux pump subunit AcrA (membrane-fusion protein)